MNGTHAATVSNANAHSAIARPIGGSHSHKPSHETARKIPTAVASVAIGGHSRSQKPVHRARRSARPRVSPASGRRDASFTLLASVTRSLPDLLKIGDYPHTEQRQ